MTDDNLCNACEVVTRRLEEFRSATDEEKRTHLGLSGDVERFGCRVARCECPRCGLIGLGVEWSKIGNADSVPHGGVAPRSPRV